MYGPRLKRREEPSIYDLDLQPLMTFDCVVEEKSTASVDATSLETEEGFDATDHIRAKPRELRLSASFTNTPNNVESDGWRDISLYRELLRLQGLAQPVVLACGLDILDPCVIVDVSAPRSAKTGQRVDCEITCRQIRTVRATHVRVSQNVRAELSGTVTNTQDDGRQPTEGAEGQGRTSVARRGANAVVDVVDSLFGGG